MSMYSSSMSFHGLMAHSFLALNNIPLSGCTAVYVSIHLLEEALVASELGWVKLLWTPVSRFVCKYKLSALWGYIPKNRVAGLYCTSTFSFAGNFRAVFQSGCAVSHFPQQRMTVPVAPHPCQHLVLSVLWILAAPTGVLWHPIFFKN